MKYAYHAKRCGGLLIAAALAACSSQGEGGSGGGIFDIASDGPSCDSDDAKALIADLATQKGLLLGDLQGTGLRQGSAAIRRIQSLPEYSVVAQQAAERDQLCPPVSAWDPNWREGRDARCYSGPHSGEVMLNAFVSRSLGEQWPQTLKNATYSLENIIVTANDGTTGAVACKAELNFAAPDWGGAKQIIEYTVERTTEGKTYATLY